jgi:hypothetical protein
MKYRTDGHGAGFDGFRDEELTSPIGPRELRRSTTHLNLDATASEPDSAIICEPSLERSSFFRQLDPYRCPSSDPYPLSVREPG